MALIIIMVKKKDEKGRKGNMYVYIYKGIYLFVLGMF